MRFGVNNYSDESSDDEAPILPSDPPLYRYNSRLPTFKNDDAVGQRFEPKQVKLASVVKPRRPSWNAGSLGSDGENTEDSGDSDDEGDSSVDLDLGSDSDSEEDEWPVGPVGSIGVKGWNRRQGAEGRVKDGAQDRRFLHGRSDAVEAWDEERKANSWATANRTFHLSLARSRSQPPPSSGTVPSTSDVASLLSSLTLQHDAAQKAVLESFQARHTALWSSIEGAIAAAERDEKLLEEKRLKEEEAARKALADREAAEKEKKVDEERKAQEAQAKEQERRKKEEAEGEAKQKRLEEERKKAELEAEKVKELTGEGSPKAEWAKWQAKMTEIKTTALPVVSQNPEWRKLCFAAKRAITPKVGQLTSSAAATLRIITQLDQVLNGLRPEPACYTWALNHLSKALVKQAETEVTAKLSTAYPLGRVVIGLLLRGHAELGDVLMARLVKKCFWITGWWPRKEPGQSDEMHQRALGHAPPSAGESLVQYAQRQSGIIALYAAILQTSPVAPPQAPNATPPLANVPAHLRPAAMWRTLMLLLRPPLVSLEPTPLLVVTFLEIAGPRMSEIFGRQTNKVFEALLREGCRDATNPVGFSDKAKSSRVRLLLWLEEWEKGRIEEIAGRSPDP